MLFTAGRQGRLTFIILMLNFTKLETGWLIKNACG